MLHVFFADLLLWEVVGPTVPESWARVGRRRDMSMRREDMYILKKRSAQQGTSGWVEGKRA